MPLIFASEAPTLSEVNYLDVYGVHYEFPAQYRAYIAKGDQFVYYRGARAGGSPVYLGHGIVGDVDMSPTPDHFLALVHDVITFDKPLPAKTPSGDYLETGSPKGTNWANGVRRISFDTFEMIRRGAEGPPVAASAHAVSPAHASTMEAYSVAVVVQLLSAEFGAGEVSVMPPNNPGFDIEVATPDGPLHVEVKGTILSAPAFHLSEGQRLHAERMQQHWRLCVVYGIDTKAGTHAVEQCDGGELATAAVLVPQAWTGILKSSD